MKKFSLLSALMVSASLVACGGGDPKSSSDKPSNLFPDSFVPPASSSSSSSSAASINNEAIPFHENFDGAVNTRGFFSADYHGLNSDSSVPFYYATGGFLDEEGNPSPTATSWITADANRKLQIGNGRFTLGQTRLEAGTTTADSSIPTWGEFDLSKDYRLSFCVTQVSSPSGSNFEIYVDNNTTGGNNSRYGAGNASRIFQVATHTLIPGQRHEVLVPATTGGTLIGTATSFLQFRVSSGGFAVIDDLVIEYAGEPHGLTLPTCVAETSTPPEPETVPMAPAAPNLIVGDSQLTVTWPSAGINVSYELFYNTSDTSDGAIAFAGNPITDTNAVLTELTNGTPYYVFIRASNMIGTGDFSPSASATPVAPTGDDTDYTWGFNPLAYQNLDGFFKAPFSDSGNNEVSTSDETHELDGLLIFLSNGTALRYRGQDNRWNFNGHSWAGGSSVMVPPLGETAPELRAYVGVPIDSGKAVTLTVSYQQSSGGGADSGKIVLIGSDNTVLAQQDALSGSGTISYTAANGHSLSHIKIAYSREGAGGGGMHIGEIVKTYGASAEGIWTAEALGLVGSADIPPSGSVSVNTGSELTLTATGGSLSSSAHQLFFAHQQIAMSDFTFTARVASVTGASVASSNSYRFGLMIMSNIEPQVDYANLGGWADAGFYVDGDTELVGSRGNMKPDGSRTRSNINDLAVGDYIRFEVYDDGDKKRVKRLTSTDGIIFSQANSTTDFNATNDTDNWFVGFYGAPGDNEITIAFDNISIAPYVAE